MTMMHQEKGVQIELTKTQYLALLKTIYLGNWMANANTHGPSTHDEYDKIADLFFSLAPKFGFSEKIEHELEYGDGQAQTEINRLIEEYDDDIFWDELCERLGERDFDHSYSPKELSVMSRDDRYTALQEHIIAWEEEAEDHGLERIQVKELSPDHIKNMHIERIATTKKALSIELSPKAKEVEQELLSLLIETDSEHTVDDVKETIYNETEPGDFKELIMLFDDGDPNKLSSVLEILNDAWNNFPHKILGDKSPNDILKEHREKQK